MSFAHRLLSATLAFHIDRSLQGAVHAHATPLPLARAEHGSGLRNEARLERSETSVASPDWDTTDMPGVGRAQGEMMVKLYAPNDADNPLVSVLHADLKGLPPSTVITCGHDPLRTDGVWLAEALREAGVPTLHTHYDEMPHGFLMFSRLTRRADESMDEMARETTKAFENLQASGARSPVRPLAPQRA